MVGIDHYVAWPRLENGVNDATGASQLFRQLGFEEVAPPLLDGAATSEAMRRLVTDDLAQLSSDDSLVLFFAGHGHTHTAHFGDMSVKTGCVIPVDASPPRGHISASWLRLDTWLSDIARLPPRHILVIVDACHSGISLGALHKWRADGQGPPEGLSALQARRSRRIITSALDDQLAMDSGPYPGHSLFTGCLIEALSGGLARNGQHVATGRELGQYLQKRVRSYPHSTQTPDFGAFELDDRGDIVVLLSVEKAPVQETTESAAKFFEKTAPILLAGSSGQVEMGSRPRLRTGLGIATGSMVSALLIAIVCRGGARPQGVHQGAIGDAGPGGAEPPKPTTTVTLRTPDAAAPDAAPATPPSPVSPKPERPISTPSPSHRAQLPKTGPRTSDGPRAALPSSKCSREHFAKIWSAETLKAGEADAAREELHACHKAGEINDTDFDRYYKGLLNKQ